MRLKVKAPSLSISQTRRLSLSPQNLNPQNPRDSIHGDSSTVLHSSAVRLRPIHLLQPRLLLLLLPHALSPPATPIPRPLRPRAASRRRIPRSGAVSRLLCPAAVSTGSFVFLIVRLQLTRVLNVWLLIWWWWNVNRRSSCSRETRRRSRRRLWRV